MKSNQMLCVILLSALMISTHWGYAQETSPSPKSFSSFGIQASTVAAIGLHFRRVTDNRFRTGVTAGYIRDANNSYYSFGTDLHIELSNRPDLHVFIGPSLGVYGGSSIDIKTRLGFATGIEVPLSGGELYENLSAGCALYYPTFYFHSDTIGFGLGAFLLYSF